MPDGLERREFLKVLGVAGTGASLFGCSTQGAERLIPYVVQPEEIVPGMSTWYRTTCRECPAGCGMDIRTREGRALKAEGNPLSPISHGALCARGQASLQGLYNPDRVPQALARAGDGGWDQLGWDAAEERLTAALAEAPGQTVFLTRSLTGTMDRLVGAWTQALGIEWVRYETFAWEPLRAANRLLFGIDGVPSHDFANADVVVSFGADFLETWLSPVDYAHGFGHSHSYANGRRGRFVSVGPHHSLTGLNADEWLATRPGTEHLVALAMARSIVDVGAGQAGGAAALLETVDVEAFADAAGIPADRLRGIAGDFANGGRSLAVGPGVASTTGAATALAAAVQVLNLVAGNIGRTVQFGRQELAGRAGGYAQLRALVERMRAGEVGALLVYGPNPLYSMPTADEVGPALEAVPFIASFSQMRDETSQHASLLLPDHHFLESWGDYVPRTGVYSLVQPVMTPVFATKQTGDVLLSVARRAGTALPTTATTYHDYLRESWAQDVFPQVDAALPFEDWWREALEQGTVVIDAPEPAVTLDPAGLATLQWEVPEFTGGDGADFYLVVYPSYRFYDGRTADRPWLQELPDPVSKISWGSWLEMHPETAEALGVEDVGAMVEVETPYGLAQLPVWQNPGMRHDVVAVQLGQGHEEFGRYARQRGANAIALLGPRVEQPSGSLVWFQTRAAVRPTGEWYRLPYTAGNQTTAGREIVETIPFDEAREVDPGVSRLAATAAAAAETARAEAVAHTESPAQATAGGGHGVEGLPGEQVVAELQGTGGFTPELVEAGPADYPPPGTFYGEYSEEHPRWGMAIDLDRCTGCSACVTACYAENNIGIVGPERVAEGRILSWIRIERYFGESQEELEAGAQFLPMLCQQCGNAPCEPVCPVYAAYHTPDGLNAQVYNRCVGTRYCANNCPYKVRYFNWFTWEWPEPLNWQLNPDVTVREKGVMEKCTFCVQRIRGTQRTARLEGREVRDGEIVPACAQTCAADAIVFGNVADPSSRAARIGSSGRGYRVLGELNTQSGIVYLKKVGGSSA